MEQNENEKLKKKQRKKKKIRKKKRVEEKQRRQKIDRAVKIRSLKNHRKKKIIENRYCSTKETDDIDSKEDAAYKLRQS